MGSQKIFDALLELRALGTITTTETCAAVNTFMPGKVDDAKVVIEITAVSGTTPTLAPVLQVSNDGSNWFPVAGLSGLNAVGRYEMAWTGEGSEALCPNADRCRLVSTVAGTTPSFTYRAFATKG